MAQISVEDSFNLPIDALSGDPEFFVVSIIIERLNAAVADDIL
ncbi:hypothetical protein [Dissulfurispira sp.]